MVVDEIAIFQERHWLTSGRLEVTNVHRGDIVEIGARANDDSPLHIHVDGAGVIAWHAMPADPARNLYQPHGAAVAGQLCVTGKEDNTLARGLGQ